LLGVNQLLDDAARSGVKLMSLEDALMGAMEGEAAQEAMAHDGVLETPW
jgi:hypothetical protein